MTVSSMGSRLKSGIFGQLFSQGVNVVYPLVSLPLLLTAWTLPQFADWAVLSAIPAYLSISDLGTVTVSSNEMAIALGRGDLGRARALFRGTLVVVAGVGTAIGVAVVALAETPLFVHVLALRTLSADDTQVVVGLLAVYVALNMTTQVGYASLYAHGRYGRGSFLLSSARLVDLGALALVPVLNATIVEAAGYLVAGRIATTAIVLTVQSRGASWIGVSPSVGASRAARDIIPSSLAVTLFPIGNVLNTEGTTVVLNQVAQPVVVATFVALRTLTRAGLSITRMVEAVARPELALAWGRSDGPAFRRTYKAQFTLSVWAAAAMGAGILVVAEPLVSIWTSGRVDSDRGILSVLVAISFAGTAWLAQLSTLLATNNHARVARRYAVLSLASLLFFGLLLSVAPVWVALCAFAAADLLMLRVVGAESSRVSGVPPADLVRALSSPPVTPRRFREALAGGASDV